jgi:DNA-directed RNA polymerase subunit RPC12/RpoP
MLIHYEYICEKCGETFVGFGEELERHDCTTEGETCGGAGLLQGHWSAPQTKEVEDEKQ